MKTTNEQIAEVEANFAADLALVRQRDGSDSGWRSTLERIKTEAIKVILAKEKILKWWKEDLALDKEPGLVKLDITLLDGDSLRITPDEEFESILMKMLEDIADNTITNKVKIKGLSIYDDKSLSVPSDLIKLFTAMQHNGNINSLDLSSNYTAFYSNSDHGNPIEASILSSFIQTLTTNPYLEYLNLSSTGISEVSMTRIVSVLKTLSSLSSLNVSDNSIGKPDLLELTNYIIENRSLSEVNISRMHINIEASIFIKNVAMIMSARPDITLTVFDKAYQTSPELERELCNLAKARFVEYVDGLKVKLFQIIPIELSSFIIDYLPTSENDNMVTIMGLEALPDLGAVEIHV
jgi:hypothetical protein